MRSKFKESGDMARGGDPFEIMWDATHATANWKEAFVANLGVTVDQVNVCCQ